MRRLLIVSETFLIQGLGLVVLPAPATSEVRGPCEAQVELRRPDGSIEPATLTVRHERLNPARRVNHWNVSFKSLAKVAVPIGTEVWCSEDLFHSVSATQ